MTDLIEKLREISEWNHNDFHEIDDIGPVLKTAEDAANEIQRLRNALVLIASLRQHQYAPGENAQSLARAALEPDSKLSSIPSDD